MTNYNWDESEHPRDDIGRFTYKNGSCATTDYEKREREMQKRADILYPTMKDKNDIIQNSSNTRKYFDTKLGGNILEEIKTISGNIRNTINDKLKSENIYKKNDNYNEIYDTCKDISQDIYEKVASNNINGFKSSYEQINKNTGFYGKVYINPKEKTAIIVFKGTDILSGKDWSKNDIQMVLRNLPQQWEDAKKLYMDTKSRLGSSYKIIFTGHSLGGSLAQLMGAKYGNKTVTFNAYGVGNLKGAEIKYKDNIINYAHPKDVVSNFPGSRHAGKIIYTKNNYGYIEDARKIKNHKIDTIGDLKKKLHTGAKY